MRIAILTTGRYHVCDLARELHAQGHDVKFYSIVPTKRLGKFGLPAKCCRWLLPYVLPIAAAKYGLDKTKLKDFSNWLFVSAVDQVAARLIEPCDVLIGMSGTTVASAMAVKRKYGAQVWIERGSRHIESQRDILANMPPNNIPGSKHRDRVADSTVRREVAGYALADTIVIASMHVEESFVERGFDRKKFFRTPYGMDLKMFPPTEAPQTQPPTIITVGNWGLQKGCDILLEAWRAMKGEAKLMHVGGVVDLALPTDEGFTHVDPVDQKQLVEFYKQAAVFVLMSRQDGFGMVIIQALSCGLPVVCSDRTGGEDMKPYVSVPETVTVVPHENIEALTAGIRRALAWVKTQPPGVRDPMGESRSKLSWRDYGVRYNEALRERVKK